MRITSLDMVLIELDFALYRVWDRIDEMADEALQRLDDLVDLMQLRADYQDFRFQILSVMPLGIQTTHDERLVRWWAKRDGFGHIVDALIDELSPKGVGIALALRD